MELEEMKTQWQEMSAKIEKQKQLTDSLIIKMTKADYKNKLNKIFIPEAVSTIIAFAFVLFVIINFQKLSTPYLKVCGIISALILLVLPVLSLNAIRKMRSVNILDNNYKQSLLQYSKSKLQFVFVQKLSFYLTSVLMVVMLPVMIQFNGRNPFIGTRLWLWYAIMFPFYYFLARWVLKSYTRSAVDAENILKELNK